MNTHDYFKTLQGVDDFISYSNKYQMTNQSLMNNLQNLQDHFDLSCKILKSIS